MQTGSRANTKEKITEPGANKLVSNYVNKVKLSLRPVFNNFIQVRFNKKEYRFQPSLRFKIQGQALGLSLFLCLLFAFGFVPGAVLAILFLLCLIVLCKRPLSSKLAPRV